MCLIKKKQFNFIIKYYVTFIIINFKIFKKTVSNSNKKDDINFINNNNHPKPIFYINLQMQKIIINLMKKIMMIKMKKKMLFIKKHINSILLFLTFS